MGRSSTSAGEALVGCNSYLRQRRPRIAALRFLEIPEAVSRALPQAARTIGRPLDVLTDFHQRP